MGAIFMGRFGVWSAALVVALSTAGCAAAGGGGSGGAAEAGGKLSCLLDLQFDGPVSGQLIATVDVACDFPVASSTTVLSVLGKSAGSSAMSWQNFGDPKKSTQVPPVSLTYKALCSGGDWEAEASITGVGPNAQPFHSTATQRLGGTLTDGDCKASG
ncbi:MAG TPA: hypothetical protein VGX23_11940 [Actinocrinis sp.]|nr:hypothetical protein [Actinocrinis sp.]